MYWLAWRACGGPAGMGFMSDRAGVEREDVWQAVSGQSLTDYCLPQGKQLEPYGDYVFGRMMKMGLKIKPDCVEWRDSPLSTEYEAWSRRYPTYMDLAKAAQESLEMAAAAASN
jgi:hypothetical protein